MINADPSGNDEANFTVAEDNFPLFRSDIPLAPPAQADEAKPEEAGMFIEKLNTEIRISLDYYNRKFAQKKINRILLIGGQEISSSAEAFVKELGFSFSFVDPSRLIGKPGISDPGILKSFSSALFGQLKPVVKINLLSAWSRSRQSKEGASFMPPGLANALSGLKLEKKFLVSAGLIVAAGIALGALSLIPIQHQINEIISSRLKVPQLNESPTLEELSGLESKYNQKVSDLNNLIKKQLYFTPELAVIPKILPEGVWLDDFSFVNSKTKKEFSLEGKIYLQDSRRESAALEALLFALKNDANFSKNFPDIRIISVDAVNINASPVTQFKIFGTKQQKRQEEYEP